MINPTSSQKIDDDSHEKMVHLHAMFDTIHKSPDDINFDEAREILDQIEQSQKQKERKSSSDKENIDLIKSEISSMAIDVYDSIDAVRHDLNMVAFVINGFCEGAIPDEDKIQSFGVIYYGQVLKNFNSAYNLIDKYTSLVKKIS